MSVADGRVDSRHWPWCWAATGATRLTTGSVTPAADGGVVATIKVSASTNSAEIYVTVYSDGSANRTIGPACNSALDGKPAMFLPG